MKQKINFHLKSGSAQEQLTERQELLRAYSDLDLDLAALTQVGFDVERVSDTNCENLVGSVEIPVGVAGPVKVISKHLDGQVVVPLATTEGALVASVSRGAKILNLSGGAKIISRQVGVSRAPVFWCQDGHQADEFAQWLTDHTQQLAEWTQSTSSHLKFLNLQTWVRGNLVFARFSFDPDQAMGMNMVSIALSHAAEMLKAEFPSVKLLSISSNVCTDKKDAVVNRLFGRGYWVQVETQIPREVVENNLHANFAEIVQTYQAKLMVGSNLAGTFSQNMQAANVVAACYAATGQDLAHVVEGSQATVILESRPDSLYMAVTLPSVLVGTVGGGTWLPAQTQARQIILPQREITSHQLAEVVGVGVLAGEISGLAALATQTLACAHQKLARRS